MLKLLRLEKEVHASFALTSQTIKVTSTVCDNCLVGMEKILNLWVEDLIEPYSR